MFRICTLKTNYGHKYQVNLEQKMQEMDISKMAKISRTSTFCTTKFSTFLKFLVVFVVSPTTHEIVLNLISPVGG